MKGPVLVTGATGFVGGHLVRALAEKNIPVYAGMRRAAPKSLPEGVEPRVFPTLDSGTDWVDILYGVESIVHLAARVHVMRENAADPLTEFRRVNVDGTRRLAEQAAEAGVKRFVFISSVKVHGEGIEDRPYSESDQPAPEDPYGQSKWEAEQALGEIAARTGLEVITLRPPLIYGPGVRGNLLSILKLIATGLPLPLGCIPNHRSMLYVGNLVDAILLCLTHPLVQNGTYLLRDGVDLSTSELIEGLARSMGKHPWLLPAPVGLLRLAARLTGREGFAKRLLGSLTVDDSRIRHTLGWMPPFAPEEGMAMTAQAFMAQKK